MYSTLIIGSGNRIKTNYLPALSCVKEHFEITGVHSRTEAKRNAVAQKWGIPSIEKLEQVDFSKVDLVILSITLKNNKQVLQKLAPYSSNLILIIDTPVLPLNDLDAVKVLNKFKKVIVTEDFMNFPQFDLMREFVKKGFLGKLQKIILEQSGYRYHGLALIRSFSNFEKIVYSQIVSSSQQDVNINYKFKNGLLGCVKEPYKRLDGAITLVGDQGILATEEKRIENGLSLYRLKEIWEQENFQGFKIEGENVNLSSQVRFYDSIKSMPNNENNSHFNVLKTCGLIQVFQSLLELNTHSKYTVLDGLYDNSITSLARKYNQFWDFSGLSFRLKLYLSQMPYR